MKVLTLYQPWATLVAIGAKKIETRSWKTDYRGPLAIHAGMNRKFTKGEILTEICRKCLCLLHERLIFGAIIAICNLDRCQRIFPLELPNDLPPEPERSFGDYTAGRYMWFLSDIKKLEHPIPAKGAMGLWEWEPSVV
jgi:hypothetical protein